MKRINLLQHSYMKRISLMKINEKSDHIYCIIYCIIDLIDSWRLLFWKTMIFNEIFIKRKIDLSKFGKIVYIIFYAFH